jgi:hypothetical protein
MTASYLAIVSLLYSPDTDSDKNYDAETFSLRTRLTFDVASISCNIYSPTCDQIRQQTEQMPLPAAKKKKIGENPKTRDRPSQTAG